MTRKISLIVGIAVVALTVGVPAAFGEGRLAGSLEPDAVAYFYANERATVGDHVGNTLVSRPDSHEVARPFAYADAAERAQRIAGYGGREVIGLSGDDHVTGPTNVPVADPTVSSGRELEWPQIGIGFGVGILLMFGLWLAMRTTRIRPLAH
jgi:hypothetical protein